MSKVWVGSLTSPHHDAVKVRGIFKDYAEGCAWLEETMAEMGGEWLIYVGENKSQVYCRKDGYALHLDQRIK